MTTIAELGVDVEVDFDDSDLERGARDAERHFDRMSDAAEKASDDVDRAAKKMGDGPRNSFAKLNDVGEDGGRDAGDGFLSGFNDRVTKGARGVLKFFKSEMAVAGKPIAVTLGTAFSAQFLASIASGLASGAANVAHGLGAVVALLPAAALAGALAFGTLKVAVSGVGDALSAGLTGDTEAFEEALEGLSPSARAFAREVVGMKGRLDELKSTVQENFFAPLVGQVRPLAETFLPMLQTHMGGLARHFGQVGNSVTSWLTIPSVAESINVALGNSSAAAGNLAGAASHLPRAFLPLVTVGSTFLPGLSDGLRGVTARFADFMMEAERTGRLREFIQGGIDSIRQLIDTGRQLGRIFSDLGAAASTALGGLRLPEGSILDTLERGAENLREFVESAEGGEVLGQVFDTVGAVANTFLGTLERVVGMLGRVFGPIMPEILDFIEALADLKSAVLDTGLDGLEPILMAIGSVLGSVVLPALTGLARFLSENQPVLQGIGIAILTFLIPAFISWAVSAGAAAIATLLAMAPLILIGAVIAGLAALVIIHFDTIKSAIMTAFNWVRDNWPLLLAILTGPIGLAVLLITRNWDSIKAGAVAVKDGIVSAFNSVVGFVTGLPGRIGRAASGMWNGITDAFRSAINSIIRMWNGISFPSITIGGQDPLGSFGPSLPEVTIGGWELPNIPLLAEGGILTRPTLMMGGEAGAEAVLPLASFWASLDAGFGRVVTAIREAVDLVFPELRKVRGFLDHIGNGIETLIRIAQIGARNVRVFEDLASIDRRRSVHGFAEGGIVKATSGGTLGRIGEGGQDEAVIPLPRGLRSLDAMGTGPPIHVTVLGSVLSERDLIEVIRNEFGRGGFGGGLAA